MRRVGILAVGALLAGCASSSGTQNEWQSVEITLLNNSGRQLAANLVTVTPLSRTAMIPSDGKIKFEPATEGEKPLLGLRIYSSVDGDSDKTLVGEVRFTSDETSNIHLHKKVKVSLEPNKIFVKWGTHAKVYPYFEGAKVSGDLSLPAKESEPTQAK